MSGIFRDVYLESAGAFSVVEVAVSAGLDPSARDGQFLVNGQPVLVKGVNRHEMSPDTGYTVMGNSTGNFADYWDVFRRHPVLQGGFSRREPVNVAPG